MYTIIIGNGSLKNYHALKKEAKKAALIICADGGAKHLQKISLLPHILIGDFDSISPKQLTEYTNKGVKIHQYPSNKNDTDTALAIDLALQNGASSLSLFAVTGSRLDHSLSSVFLLKNLCEKNIPTCIFSDNNELFLINDYIELEQKDKAFVTLLALSEKVSGLTTKGLGYPLENASLELGSSLGVSNFFTENRAKISIKSGILLVITAKD